MKTLSKSQYTRGRQCLKSLWLYRHRKDLKAPFDPFQQNLADAGTEFGILARERFPGGTLIKADHDHPEEALAETKAALAAGAHTLYEAAFLHDDVLVRVDVLTEIGVGRWHLVEVKSGTKVEPVHLEDVAIQRYVLAGAGFPLAAALVAHANSAYVRCGALDLHELFAVEDVTAASAAALASVPAALSIMKHAADVPTAPAVGIGGHCTKPYGCDFEAHCWAHVPEYSVFNIGYLKMEKKLELFNAGVQLVSQVNPALHKLSEGQRRQVEVARAGQPVVDRKVIEQWLAGLVYPLAHLDFETDNPVVPPYDGLRPYSQMPFQASLRVQQVPHGPLVEYGFLGDGLADPRRGLIDFLCEHVPARGSVLAYHKSFEGGRLEELKDRDAIKAVELGSMSARLYDLADVFRTNAYVHPAMRGRWSIKAVLPALVPDMTYAGLEVADGTAAMAAYAQLRDPALPAAERARLMAALKVYCGWDTLAMVRLLAHLYEVVGVAA